ncbi:MAG TPA: sialidase family protein [Candidatus Hydrogenedentes bacterium]|nr:sialidase family protein [Candidatus Hydrogenedentota bacterium]
MMRSWRMVAVAVLAGAACAAAQEITVRETVVFDGRAGWAHGGVTYRLACGASLCEAANGDLICWWLSGTDNEPSRDNNVLAARSTDRGKTWGAPWILVEAGAEAAAVTSMQAQPDGRLVALGAGWPSELQYTVWHYFRMESKDHGATWSARESFRLRPEENVMLGRPVRLANGEFLFPASFFEKRPVPLTAPIEALARAQSEAEALALPPAPDARPDKFCTHLHGASAVTTADPELRGLTEHAGIRNRPLGLLEGTAVQLRDGRVVMLMRAEYGGFLWRADSRDNGRTWTVARQTDIPNPTSLPALLRLPDGRIALIHNAVGGVVGRGAVRDPLSVWLSDDEMETWSVKADVITGGQLAYPCPLIVDGRLVFAYDRDRRETRFVEVALPPGAGTPAK